tara:strand:+ start:474 stop:2297 length:1824 start_codon:yes stop_codon:yes gene_type:complete
MIKFRSILRKYDFSRRNIVTNFKTLVEMQELSCKKHNNRPLFGKNLEETEWTSYGEWDEKIKTFRDVLHNSSVNKGDKVAIISNNKIEWSVAAYSTYSLGGVFVPMYQTQRKKDWQYIIKNSGSKLLIITDKDIFKNCKSFLDEIKNLDKIIYLNNNYCELLNYLKFGDGVKFRFSFQNKNTVYPDENDLATIIYTSGTTGNPKGVEITHKNIISNIKGIQNSFNDFEKVCNQDDLSISFLPWAHCYGQTCELHGLISAGSSIYLSEGVDKLPDEIQKIKPTLLFSVPTLFNKIYDNINGKMADNILIKKVFNDALDTSKKVLENDFETKDKIKLYFYDKFIFSKIREKLGGRIRHSFVGGAATPIKVLKFFEYINIPIIEGYGLTETSPIITLGTLDYPSRKLGSVGKPLPENEVIIVNDENILESNKEGEILTAGSNIMNGYHNIDDNDDVFTVIDGKKYFKTGDLGYTDCENRLFITGRIKEQYKLENGKYVIPTFLEGNYIMSQYINQIMIYGDNKSYNIALIVPNFDTLKANNIDTNNLSNFYLEEIKSISKINNIKNYEVPKEVLIVNEEFSISNGLLTPKLSIKRNNVFETYQKEILSLY